MSRVTKHHTLTPLAHGALNRCFGCGLDNLSGLRLRFFSDPDHNIVCHFRLARRFAGPPGHSHGGIIATLLDEAMSKANRARNVLAMTRQMQVEYLRPVPLAVPLTLTARHVENHGRRHFCEAQIADASGHTLATAKRSSSPSSQTTSHANPANSPHNPRLCHRGPRRSLRHR